MYTSDLGFITAVNEAELSLKEGGMPVGAAVMAPDGEIIGRGHNTRLQTGSAITHVRLNVPYTVTNTFS